MKISSKVFLLSFMTPVLLALLLVARSDRSIPGVTVAKLVAGCQVELYDTTTQPAFTVVLSCPRVDSIRLWPLPFLQPFYEDRYQRPAPAPSQEEARQPDNWSKTGTKINTFTGHLYLY